MNTALRILETHGDDTLARVFVAQTADGACVECVESVAPPVPREKKWVLIVSTLKGCPVGCAMCDAGGHYKGKLSADEIIAQIDFLVRRRFPDKVVPCAVTKIQFARMGDPALNDAVLTVLKRLPDLYDFAGLMPSYSTVAPKNCARTIDALKTIKDERYGGGMFQMQFSVHTTNDALRRHLVPMATLPLAQMGELGSRFFSAGDRKVTLNFAAVRGFPVDAGAVARHCSPDHFAIKLTPVNPTFAAANAHLEGVVQPGDPASWEPIRERFAAYGFDVIVSIGELQENAIGSNCGMFVAKRAQRT